MADLDLSDGVHVHVVVRLIFLRQCGVQNQKYLAKKEMNYQTRPRSVKTQYW